MNKINLKSVLTNIIDQSYDYPPHFETSSIDIKKIIYSNYPCCYRNVINSTISCYGIKENMKKALHTILFEINLIRFSSYFLHISPKM